MTLAQGSYNRNARVCLFNTIHPIDPNAGPAGSGDDHIDWEGFRDAIVESGYAGPVVIESFTAENETIATAASVWRPLASSQDAIAVDGLAFLRRLFG